MKRNVKLVKRPITVNNRMKQIRKAVEKELNVVLRRHANLRDRATDGWSSRNKPKFPKFIKYIGSPRKKVQFGIMVKAPNANQASISVYRMLNDDRAGGKATKVRRVFLLAGWRNKTAVRRFGKMGAGGEIARKKGKKKGQKGAPITANDAEGIDARLWDETANDILSEQKIGGMTSVMIINGYRRGMKKVQGKTRNG